jgi:hypothetical protein
MLESEVQMFSKQLKQIAISRVSLLDAHTPVPQACQSESRDRSRALLDPRLVVY